MRAKTFSRDRRNSHRQHYTTKQNHSVRETKVLFHIIKRSSIRATSHEPIDRTDSGPHSGLKAELTFPPPGVPNHELNQRNSGSLPAPGERESVEFTLGDALEHDPGKKNCVLPELLAHYEASRPASSTANSQYQHLLHNIFSKKLGLLRTQQQFAKLRSSSDK